jgi:hypothetical protein
MKSKSCSRRISWLPFVLLLVIVACNKTDNTDNGDPEKVKEEEIVNGTPLSGNPSTTCTNAPNYGDSIVFSKPRTGGDIFVEPINNTGIQGTYLSWPEGLIINRTSGAINLSQSETGVRYKVAFVKKGTTDTCVSQLIVGGLSYMDHIYVIDQHDTLAKPIFNADPFGPSICDASDDSDYPDGGANGNNKCQFDNAAPGSKANDLRLRVRTTSGIINLKKSLTDGLFPPNVKNGDFKMIPIQYKLSDASNQALQTVTVQVMYFDKVTSIPQTLQLEISSKNTSMLSYQVVNGKPRPPLLIIAGLSR